MWQMRFFIKPDRTPHKEGNSMMKLYRTDNKVLKEIKH